MGLRNMMNNYFYGKQGKGDFTIEEAAKFGLRCAALTLESPEAVNPELKTLSL